MDEKMSYGLCFKYVLSNEKSLMEKILIKEFKKFSCFLKKMALLKSYYFDTIFIVNYSLNFVKLNINLNK